MVAGPQPTEAARRWGARLRLYVALNQVVARANTDAVLSTVALILFASGAGLALGLGWALMLTALLLVLVTPIGIALRLLVRGK